MQDINKIEDTIRSFKSKNSIDLQDEHAIAVVHLTNEHKVDFSLATSRTSPGNKDHGIDAWHYDQSKETLFIYQSKYSPNKSLVLRGFQDLMEAAKWLAPVLETGNLNEVPTNPAVYNLAQLLAQKKDSINEIAFRLISPFNHNELDDCEAYEKAKKKLKISGLNNSSHKRTVTLEAKEYNIEDTIIIPPPEYYSISCQNNLNFSLAPDARLDIITTTIYGLVELYRSRGNDLFEKNLRLYLGGKQAVQKVEHPMIETLKRISEGKIEANAFAFYHGGITLSAFDCKNEKNGQISLYEPCVINGCQTICIADKYLRELDKASLKSSGAAAEKIERFKEIPVIAKIVTGASDEQLREIAICNNRQNPIDPWQLFSNDTIHIEIEAALRDIGVFYERQSGKFNALMTKSQTLKQYPNTNGTFITVEGLGQIICLCRRQFVFSAKRSEIFSNKESHDEVFDQTIPDQAQDIIWAWNAHKAAKRALSNYIKEHEIHNNEESKGIFEKKQNVKQAMHFMAMRHLYERCHDLSADYVTCLMKNAPPPLVAECESFYRQVIRKMKDWYMKESKDLQLPVSNRSMENYLPRICREVGLDVGGPMPFTKETMSWPEVSG